MQALDDAAARAAPGHGAGVACSASGCRLAAVGTDVLRSIFMHLPDLGAATAAASFLRDAAQCEDFQVR
jgi:hypothetical protein